MKIFRSRAAVSLAALAALSLTASPAFARGRHHHYRHHHHHSSGSGNLLAGLLIGGAVVAIASAASKSNRERVQDEPVRYPGGPYDSPAESGYAGTPQVSGYGDPAYPGGPRAGVSFDAAADACASEIEDGERRIGSVDNVRRMGERYSVEGHLEDGRGYACSVDETGRIRSVAVDGRAMI
ncbi:hypothetical protein [Novosphingobium beihaiensis]|uniref:Secreted protein n=1 Tax=Novosphingobium beihaiensis TaxID=2930389 RepID=A0ABT0BK83_9SPHN|nr:hypothetical protein [Novosphingobium beihaiensis]MCJ2185452.1 hypothetical protein [Novosphingobium beihaiensis]